MLTRIGTLTALLGSLPLAAQSSEALERMLEQKLESRFLEKAEWVTDWDEARSRAAQEGKVIFAYFTRSYAP